MMSYAGVAGVSAPAFVERLRESRASRQGRVSPGSSAPAFVERTWTRLRSGLSGRVAGVSAPAFVERRTPGGGNPELPRRVAGVSASAFVERSRPLHPLGTPRSRRRRPELHRCERQRRGGFRMIPRCRKSRAPDARRPALRSQPAPVALRTAVTCAHVCAHRSSSGTQAGGRGTPKTIEPPANILLSCLYAPQRLRAEPSPIRFAIANVITGSKYIT